MVTSSSRGTALDEHLRWLATWARPSTVISRRRALRRFERQAGTTLLEATRETVEAWFLSLTTTPTSRGCEIGHVASFYEWAALFEYRVDNPTLRIRRPRMPKYVPRPMGEAEVRVALACASPRVLPMLLLMVGCGLRACEVATLTASDVHRDSDGAARIFVRDGKGGKQRWVPCPPLVADSLRGLPTRGALFLRQTGGRGPVSAHLVSSLVNEHLHSVGITATGHALRHTFATAFQEECGDLLVTRDVLGHGSVATTQVYVKVSGQGSSSAANRALGRLTS